MRVWNNLTASALVAGLWLAATACGDDPGATSTGSAGTGASGVGGSSKSTASGGADGSSGGAGGAGGVTGSTGGGVSTYSSGVGGAPTSTVTCLNQIYECGDLQDNDKDGLVDSQDPDCLGPCDNTEDSFYGGIPGQAGDPCRVDCYFDADSGQGNDQCYWSHWCDPNETAPSYYPEPENGALCAYNDKKSVPIADGAPKSCGELYETQSDACMDYCGPLTPNGCDCFGCCELPAESGKYVWLGSEGKDGTSVCTLADIDDPTKCHPCLPVKACQNDCKKCELCIGKPTVPDECFSGGSGATSGSGSGSGGSGGGTNPDQCPAGVQACGFEGQEPCPSGYYCVTGCCQAAPK